MEYVTKAELIQAINVLSPVFAFTFIMSCFVLFHTIKVLLDNLQFLLEARKNGRS
ncbi:hypothetical protein GCM10009129_23440 [Psychrobacter aestuarii]|uniref:Uncharacterized protein n=1 Tax=Psychrobacter aestuarii TaxID=556327 RepID=A0ABP3FVX8_9GAMM